MDHDAGSRKGRCGSLVMMGSTRLEISTFERLVAELQKSAASSAGFKDSDVLDAKLLGPPRQEFIEFCFGGPDNLVL